MNYLIEKLKNEFLINKNFKSHAIIVAAIIAIITLLEIALLFPRVKAPCKNLQLEASPLNSGLVLYHPFNNQSYYGENSGLICDFSGNKNNGFVNDSHWNSSGGYSKEGAFEFNGISSKIKVKDKDNLSPLNRKFTVSFFIQFKNKDFVGEGSGKDYINFLGKGSTDSGYEWLFRQYNSSNSKLRNNRISFYVFNHQGGLGAGSYFQENIVLGEWVYISGVIDGDEIKIYKNGVLKNTQHLNSYNITPQNTPSDLYLGTVNQEVYLNGSIDELRIYNKALNDSEIRNLYLLSAS